MPPRESLGAVPCLCCGREVPVKKSTGGSVSVSCPWCDLSAYAKAGTEAFKKIMAKLPPDEPIPVVKKTAAPVPENIPLPAPAPVRRNPLFPGA